MTREKLVKLYERSKGLMEQSKADMERYGREIEELDKDDFWKTAQKYHISAEELKRLIRIRNTQKKICGNV